MSANKEYLQSFVTSITGQPVLVTDASSFSKTRKSLELRIYLPREAFQGNKDIGKLNSDNYFLSIACIQAGMYKYNRVSRTECIQLEETMSKFSIDAQYLIKFIDFARITQLLSKEYPNLGAIISGCFGQIIDQSSRDLSFNEYADIGEFITCFYEHLMGDDEAKNKVKYLTKIGTVYGKPIEYIYDYFEKEKHNPASSITLANEFFRLYKECMNDFRLLAHKNTSRNLAINTEFADTPLIFPKQLIKIMNLDYLLLWPRSEIRNSKYQHEKMPWGIQKSFARVTPRDAKESMTEAEIKSHLALHKSEEELSTLITLLHETENKMFSKHYYYTQEDTKKKKKLKRKISAKKREIKEIKAADKWKGTIDRSLDRDLGLESARLYQIKTEMEQIKPAKRQIVRYSNRGQLNMTNYARFEFARRHGVSANPRVFQTFRPLIRDVSSVLLLDASASTAKTYNGRILFDRICEEALYFSHAMNELGDKFAILAYNSYSQKHVNIYSIKAFDQTFDPNRILIECARINPAMNNRDGAAIRFASSKLLESSSKMRLLYHISDMRPSDVTIDEITDEEIPNQKYTGKYAIEDLVESLTTARNSNVIPIAVCVRPVATRKRLSSKITSKLNTKMIKNIGSNIGDKKQSDADIIKAYSHFISIPDLSLGEISKKLQEIFVNITI